ncbi:MAG: lysylphosphatidylglycerol synthase transmembrane domain-containing protein [Hyphomicrobiales bacterium]|nr:lysylphosphatidylglycerol synthase transmembrane domain-containing protein [Hyphomicrobiales bacterium]
MTVALAFLIYLIIALSLNWEKSSGAILSISPVEWMIILSLPLFSYCLRAIRWCGYMALLGHRVPLFQHIAVYFAGFAFTATPGKIGETVRSTYLEHHGVPYRHSLAAFFAERLLDVITLILLSLLFVSAFSHYQLLGGVILVIAGVLVAVRSERLQGWFADRFAKLSSPKLRTFGQHFIDLVQAAAALLKSGPLLAGLALGLIGWGVEGCALHLILAGLGADVSWPVAVGVYSLAILAGALSFIPGGLGSTEAVMGGSLILLGVDAGTAVAAMLICRLVTLWFAVTIGLVFVLVLEGTGSAGKGYLSEAPPSLAAGETQDTQD